MISIYAQESGSLQYDFVWYKFAPCLAAYKCSETKKKKIQFDSVAQANKLNKYIFYFPCLVYLIHWKCPKKRNLSFKT